MDKIRIYDVFDTLVTSNLFEELEKADRELCAKARADYRAVHEEVDSFERKARAAGKIQTVQLPGVKEALERELKKGYRIGVYSSGPQDNIHVMLTEGGIRGLVEVVISANDVGNKDKQESFMRLHWDMTNKKDCSIASYADDSARACITAVKSQVAEYVYHVTSGKDTCPAGVMRVSSIAQIL